MCEHHPRLLATTKFDSDAESCHSAPYNDNIIHLVINHNIISNRP